MRPEANAVGQSRSMTLSAGGAEASVNTTYIGLVMIVAGAFLESVGFLGAGPWRNNAKTDNGPA